MTDYTNASPDPSRYAAFQNRVRTPEPHLPLRKASPQRLQSRKAAPHPLLIKAQDGSRGFRPATNPSTIAPRHTPVTASYTRSEQVGSGHEHNHKLSFETIVPDGRRDAFRKASLGTPASTSWEHRNGSPARAGAGPLRASRSVSEGLRSLRGRLARQQGRDSGSNLSSSSVDGGDVPAVPDLSADDVRTSFRSALTSNSSLMDGSTERSSVATAISSASDHVETSRDWREPSDVDFSVEDAIGMYADGFESPRQSLDTEGQKLQRPSSSPAVRTSTDQAHKRGRSATFGTGTQPRQQQPAEMIEPIPTLDQPIIRTSAQIVSGRHSSLHDERKPALISASKRSQSPIGVPRDRYGFKKASLHITVEQFDEWERGYSGHVERRQAKWEALLRQYGLSTDNPTRFPPKSEKLKRFVRKGVPPEWRGSVWFWYAGGPGLQKKHEGLYFNLLQRIRQGDALKDIDKEHIERDLNRTFPDNIRFKPDPIASGSDSPSHQNDKNEDAPPEMPIIKSLRRVLQAFAVHNPNIGYCQSLNFIVGLLLLFLNEDEEKTFLLLNVVTTDFLPGTHGVSLEGANIDIAVLMSAIKEHLPAIWLKLDDKPSGPPGGWPPPLPTVSLATTAWFMSLFVGTLPIECVLRTWDCLFFEGSKTLFRIALAIFKMGETQIRAVNDPMEIFQLVQSMPRSMLDANGLMETCFKKRSGFGGLSQDTVEKRREERRKEVRKGRSMTGEPSKRKMSTVTIKGRFRSRTKGQ